MVPRRVWLRVLLLVCLPERVLLSERSIVIVPGHIAAGERECIHPGEHGPVHIGIRFSVAAVDEKCQCVAQRQGSLPTPALTRGITG